ncbi:hypothetical protein R6K71_08855 [Enterococcus faecium]|uniref:hypothetical protein n=1 Tax=Enterococcus faecium TaxID=1352 RepID=UPI00296AC6C1|nr:hypothetical protein [Enterococcus faecium]MDW3698094.1 hypothetical protein [Enterococcus faecium]
MKKLLLGLLAVCFLGGCSTQEEPEDVTYDWTPPFEDVSWGMGEDEAMEALDLDVEEAALDVTPEKYQVFSFTSAMETEVGMAAPDLVFEPGFVA